jgi:hypothetical protein
MSHQIIVIIVLTFIIHLIGTLSYSVRIAGVRTTKVAIASSLFNVLVLASRASNSIQAPLIAKHIENRILSSSFEGAETEFRLLLLAASCGTIVGAILIPAGQRIISYGVEQFTFYRSVPRLLYHFFTSMRIQAIRQLIALPAKENLKRIHMLQQLPFKILLMNAAAVSLLTVGMFAPLYAALSYPEVRATALSLSAMVNGTAVILMYVFVDPYFAILIDDAVKGTLSQNIFRRAVVLMVFARLGGTLIGQILLIPSANLIGVIAKWL